jgi:hypothetical protein
MECIVCGNVRALRMDVCWECAEAESIIEDGTDMYDKGLDSDDEPTFEGKKGDPAKTSMQKLQFLIKKGWRKVNTLEPPKR